ncbi:MAG: hypothetical protein U5Q03_06585 [Bacteroidota bacterium]|nr:hypothetical protein [Bacteroidota bacterium]
MKGIVKIILIFVLLIAASGIRAQQSSLNTLLEKDSILIGDQIKLELLFTGPEKAMLNWPELQDTLSAHVEIIRQSGIDTNRLDGELKLSRSFTITSFDSGRHKIGPFRVSYELPDDTIRYMGISQVLDLNVLTVPVDTTRAIKPIKGPKNAPLSFSEIWPWLLTGFGSLLIIGAVWYYLYIRKQSRPLIPVRQKPRMPAHIQALNELEKLKQRKLWQAGKVKDYYTELTDILRIYMEDRFGMNAMEMTSFEIMRELRKDHLQATVLEKAEATFALSDMVKFAREKPLPSDNDTSWENAKAFIEETFRKQNDPDKEEENEEIKEKQEDE